MNQLTSAKIRKTVEVDSELASAIKKLANSKNWSFSYMSYVLLRQAVNERLRKSKNDPQKEDSI